MNGIELLKQIKKGKTRYNQIILMRYLPSGKKTYMKINGKNLEWQPKEFETRMLVDDNYQFELLDKLPEEKKIPSTKTYTKFNFNNVELCKGLDEEMLKGLGFTNYYEPNWYFCRTISSNKDSKDFYETFNLTIKENFTKMNAEIYDEGYLQPSLPYVEYYLGEKSFEECSPYVQEGIKKCDEHIRFLIENGVIKFKE